MNFCTGNARACSLTGPASDFSHYQPVISCCRWTATFVRRPLSFLTVQAKRPLQEVALSRKRRTCVYSASGGVHEGDAERYARRRQQAEADFNPFPTEIYKVDYSNKPWNAALQRYKELLGQEEEDGIDLWETAFLVSRIAYPDDPDEEWCKIEVAKIAERVETKLGPEPHYPLKVIQAINEVLYEEERFSGNEEDYNNPDNSCINKVLENSLGIPITLSLLYLEIAARVKLPMIGVSLPAHFMVAPQVEGMQIFIDPFNGGEICFTEDLEERLSKIFGRPIELTPELLSEAAAVTPRQFLLRMLTNLRGIYEVKTDWEHLLAVLMFERETRGTYPQDLRDEAFCLYELEDYVNCAPLLKQYLKCEPNADDVAEVVDIYRRCKGTA